MVDINSVFLIDWCSSFFISIVFGTESLWIVKECALLLYMCLRLVSAYVLPLGLLVWTLSLLYRLCICEAAVELLVTILGLCGLGEIQLLL